MAARVSMHTHDVGPESPQMRPPPPALQLIGYDPQMAMHEARYTYAPKTRAAPLALPIQRSTPILRPPSSARLQL
jgi:hypothetical protein